MLAFPSPRDGTSISEPYAQQALTNTIVSFKDTLDWMATDDDLLRCSRIED